MWVSYKLCCLSWQIKLADFGFARHFRDEGQKPVDMTSLAGTPVFMVSESSGPVYTSQHGDSILIWSLLSAEEKN